jgi:hypothetical protein
MRVRSYYPVYEREGKKTHGKRAFVGEILKRQGIIELYLPSSAAGKGRDEYFSAKAEALDGI